MKCPYCDGTNHAAKGGHKPLTNKRITTQYRECRECRRRFAVDRRVRRLGPQASFKPTL